MVNILGGTIIKFNFDMYAGISQITGRPPLKPLAVVFNGSDFILAHKVDPDVNHFDYKMLSVIEQEAAIYMVTEGLADDLYDKMKKHWPSMIKSANVIPDISAMNIIK